MDDPRELTFTLNDRPITANVDGQRSLLRYLRDDLGMVGTKDGCGSGDCGSCVVLVNGKPVDSCVFLMRRAAGARIETIEGLARPDGTLHGKGQGVIMTADGEVVTWTGEGVARPGRGLAASWRGAVYHQTASQKLARLNGVAIVFEYEVDESGNVHSKLWEWK